MSEVKKQDEPYGYYLRVVHGDDDTSLESLSATAEDTQSQALLKGISWSFGPLTIDVSLNGTEINVSVKLLGITVASFTLDAANPKACIDVGAGVASAKLCVGVDFSQNRVYAEGEVCAVFAGCTSFNETIFTW